MRRAGLLAFSLLLAGCSGSGGRWTLAEREPPTSAPLQPAAPLPPFDPHEDRIVQVVRRVSPAVVN
ncbi:MAG: hypothetical protein ACRDH9_10935, partial [Actinomycetota bacterium]